MMARRGDSWQPNPSSAARDLRDVYHFRGEPNYHSAPLPPHRNTYRPRNEGNHHPRNTQNFNGRPSRGQRPRRAIHERPLLSRTFDDDDDEQTFTNLNAKDKFRNLEEMTDSEEDAMVESDGDFDDSRPTKRTRLDAAANARPPTLKWSNPDPYTSLPPPTETTGKRTDVVKLIRKAKISENKDDGNGVSQAEDFISFGADGADTSSPPPDAPRGPAADRDMDTGDNLGKRKRGRDRAMPRRSQREYEDVDDRILHEWLATGQINPTPWWTSHNRDDLAGVALHKEIIDFYEWVKPKDYEIEVRARVFSRLAQQFNRLEAGELKAFGSYAAGLYLPTGDMDLVFLQRSFRPGVVGPKGLPPPPKTSYLRKFADFIRKQGIAKPGSVNLIGFAKVPIIKFVDQESGLKIDLSFNNDTGVTAIETYEKWKATYPAMPIIASVVKQFLMIRGLNDVSLGGLGGFSVICLVTSLLQHMPTAGSPPHLGQLLVEFFNLYGNLLDRTSVAIRLDPPAYVDKTTYKQHLIRNENPTRLTIIDPHRPENNISGGTHDIGRVLQIFSRGHELLLDRLSEYESGDHTSFLKDLVGGDFLAYELQRKTLQGLSSSRIRSMAPVAAPSKIKTNGESSSRNDDKTMTGFVREAATASIPDTNFSKAQRRAQRLRVTRPDLAAKIKETISVNEAVLLGGYKTTETMENDLQAREKVLAKRTKA